MENDTPEPHQRVGILAAWIVVNISLVTILWTLFVRTYVTRWQLNDAETVTRVWSRTSDIFFQPIAMAPLYATVVGSGFTVIVARTLSSVATIFGISSYDVYVSVYPPIAGLGVGLAGGLAKTFDKAHQWAWALPATACSVTAFDIIGAMHDYGTAGYSMLYDRDVALTLTNVPGLSITMWSPFGALIAVQCVKVYTMPKRLCSPKAISPWAQLGRSILLASGPVILFEIGHVYLSNCPLNIISSLATNTANFLSLSVCATAAIVLVNKALLAEEFQWRWKSFAIPAVPIAVVQIGVVIVGAIKYGLEGNALRMGYAIMRVIGCGALGTLCVNCALNKTRDYLGIEPPEPFEPSTSDYTEHAKATGAADTALIGAVV